MIQMLAALSAAAALAANVPTVRDTRRRDAGPVAMSWGHGTLRSLPPGEFVPA